MALSGVSAFDPSLTLISALSPLNSRTPLAQQSLFDLTQVTASFETRISGFGQILSAVDTLQAAAQKLAAPGALTAPTATSSAAAVSGVAAAAETPAGTFSLQVDRLAQAEVLASTPLPSSSAPIGSDAATRLDFAFAGGAVTSLVLGSDTSLAGVAAAINRAGIGVTASIVGDSAGSRLVLRGQTGAVNAFTVSARGDPVLAELLTTAAGGLSQTASAQDAQGRLNGIAFTASTNTVNSPVGGLSLNLAGAGDATLSVAPNNAAVQTAVQALVAAFNKLQSAFAEAAATGFDTGLAAAQAQLGGAVTSRQGGLAAIGITRNADGTLALDAGSLSRALAADAQAVAGVFANNGQGFAEQLASQTATGGLAAGNFLQVAAAQLNADLFFRQSLQGSLFADLGLADSSQFGALGGSLSSSDLLLAQLGAATGTAGGQTSSDDLFNMLLAQTISSGLVNLNGQRGVLP